MATERALNRAKEIAAQYGGGNTQTTAGANSSRPSAIPTTQSGGVQTSAPAEQPQALTAATQSAADRANAIFKQYGEAANEARRRAAASEGEQLYLQRKQEEETALSDRRASLLNLLGTGAAMANNPYLSALEQADLARQQAENAKAFQDATKRYDEARKATDWEGRDSLIDQYKAASWGILGNAAQQAYNAAAGVQLSAADQKAATERQIETIEREKQLREELETKDVAVGNGLRAYSLPERVVNIGSSVARGIGSSGVNMLSNLGQTVGNNLVMQQAYSPERMLTDKMLGVDWEKDVKQTRAALESEETKAFYRNLDAIADQLQTDAGRDIQKAKEGLSVLGQAGVDIAQNMLEMGFDTAVGTVTGTPLASMFARVYGQSVGEARQKGADVNRQALYGLTKAGIETATEKMFDVFGVLGGGSMEGKIEKLVGRLSESDIGRTFLRVLINAQGEGVEELVSGLADPFAQLIIDSEWQGWDWSDMAYSYIIGSTIGLIGEGTQVLSGADRAKNAELRTRQGIETGLVQVGFDAKDAGKIAEITVKGMTGEELTEAEQTTLTKAQERLTQMAEEQNAQTGNSKNAAPENRSGQIGTAGGQRAVEGAGPYANNIGDIANNIGDIANYTGDIANDAADIMNNTTGSGAAATMTGGNANVENQTETEGVLGQAQTVAPTGEEADRAGAPDAAAGRASAGIETAQPGDAGAEAARPARDGAEQERVSDAGGRRNTRESAGGEADSLAERTGRHREREAKQRERAAAIRRYGDALRARGEARVVSSQELGIRNGTDAQDLTVIDKAHYNDRLRKLDEHVRRESGYDDVVFVIGTIHTVNGGKARGVITGNRIVIQLDHNRVPAENIAEHEVFHAKARTDPELVEAARQKIVERFTPEEFRRMLDSYLDALTGSVLDFDESTDPEHIQELAELVIEELMADAYADINYFGLGADRYGEVVRETVEERRGLQEQNRGGERETRGPPRDRFSYGGERAANADLAALNTAQEMEQEGTDAETIRRDTGWFRGMDGKWRFEIDDSEMQYNKWGDARFRQDHSEYAEYQDLMDRILTGELTQEESDRLHELDSMWGNELERLNRLVDRGGATLDMVLRHDALFEAYPQLRKTRVEFKDLGRGKRGYYDRRRNAIVLSSELRRDPGGTLIHEIQHAIQSIEGFTSGSSPEAWSRRLDNGYAERRRSAEFEAADKAYRDLFDSAPEELKNKIRELNRAKLDSDPDLWDELEAELYYGPYSDLFTKIDKADFERQRIRDHDRKLAAYELYRNTAGEIEARDAQRRQPWDQERRQNTSPDLGDEDTVFAEEGDKSYSLRDKKIPTREELEAKDDIPVVDIREETSGSRHDQRSNYRRSEELAGLMKTPILNRDTGEPLFVTGRSISHSFRNEGQEQILMVRHLREILENAVLTHSEPSRTADNDHTTGIYKFFGAVQTDKGVQPVKITVKEFSLAGQSLPENVRAYLVDHADNDAFATVYDGKVLVLESIEKEASGSARATSETSSDGDTHPAASNGETSSSAASSTQGNPAPDNHPSVSAISVKDLLDLVKGEDAKYIPQREVSDSTRYSVDDGDEDSDSIPSDRELLLTAASRENAGQDLTAYAKKNGKVETLERKLTHLQEAMESADEEERPQLEAMAAKTEKQLNRAKDDLGKMEANPVLKKALDRERAAWREVNPTEAARAMRTLNEENAAMRELVDYWKGQAKRTSDRDRTVMPEDTRRMARNLLREHSSEASTERIADRLQKLGNYLVSSDDLDFRTVRNWARAASREIVDNSYILVDENADTREKLRDYLRSTRLKISDELRGDVTDLADFRRQNMGMLRLAKDGRDIDSVYDELGDMFGEDLFPRDVTRNSEQLNKILDVMDRLQPSYEYMYSRYERDEMVEHVANEIIDGLLSGDVRQSKTYADRQYERMANRIAELGEKNEAAKDRLRDERRTRRQLVQSKVSELRQKSIERNESYRKRVAIDKTVRRLSKYLTENSAKNHVPENMKNLVGNLLMSIDTLSPRSGEKAQQAYLRRMDDVARVVANQLKYMDGGEMENSMFLDFPPELSDILNEHIGAIRDAVENDETWVTSRMSLKQLEELDTILNAVSKAVTTANELMASANNAKVSEVSEKTIAHLDELGPATADNKATRFLQFQNTTPYYFFKRFGEGGQQIFRGLQEGWSKLGFHSRDIIDYAEKTYTGEEARKAEGDVQEFKLHTRTLEEDGTDNLRSEDAQTVYLSKAQIMELYALSKRRQALGHLLGAGIRIGDIKDASTGKTIHQADNYLLSPEDLAEITGTLTEREKEIADALQKHMNTVGSDWGNEVSMARFGIRQFTEDNYWPIKTDSRNRAVRDPGADATNLFRLLNMSFTKSAVRDASNAIDIGSAFDTYANHMADMAKYNALGLPMLDAMKWFSYNTATDPDSRGQYTTTSVQKSAERAYGSEAQRYFIQFMKDMNGTHEGGRDLEQFGSKMLSNYKVAAVGANLRVAALQPTAYVRAAAVLDPKHLARGLAHNKQGREEAMKYSGTAVWKDLGFYDTNINNGLRAMIKHSDSAVEQIREKSMILAELGDKTTWGAIWNACKSQVSETQNLKGEALMKATAELFDEVIYRTQVMDSTMTRSHSMRQKGVYAGMTTAFMSEPTLSYNMVLDAYNEYQQELRKTGDIKKALDNAGPKLARTMAVYTATAAAASIVESLMDAWRDDDKYQSFVQKWLEAEFGDGNLLDGNLMQDLLIHNKLPFIKEFDSLLNGYSNSRMDTEWMSNIVKTYQIWRETLQLATGELDKPTKITNYGNMTPWGKLYQTLKTASQMAGLPIGNAGREVIALYNNTIGKATGNTISTYSPGAKNEVKYAVLDGWLSAEEAQRILTEEGILEDEAKAEAEVIKWTAQSQGESVTTTQAKAVQALTSSGAASTQEAVTTTAEIWDRIAALKPLPGRASVTKTQKYQTIADSDIPVEQQLTMLGALMEDDELLKTQTAYDYGVTPKIYFDAKVSMYNVSSDGQISKAEAKQALDRQSDLSNQERAVIWQLQNKTFKPKDNPYDTEVGGQVYDIITGKPASKGNLKLGSWGSGSTGTQAQSSAAVHNGLTLGIWGANASSKSAQTNGAPAQTNNATSHNGLTLGSWG